MAGFQFGDTVAEELCASSVRALRNAPPEAVPEVESLGCRWLGDGDSFISRNPPWLRPWTVPGSTLWGFPRCLALKNLPVVTLGTLEKCGNLWPGGGRDGTGSNPCSQKMETTIENSVWFRKGFRLQRQKNSLLPGPTVSSLRHRQPVSILTPRPSGSNKFQLVDFHHVQNRYFFQRIPFLIHKGITACVGDVKTIRKMRFGDLFIEVTSSKLLHLLVN
ncbi:hypothetical protein TNCV_1242811 [Trichonephila clavipes]|nr:hypothetical protein TNCV_1242811 [Trichonephila clavipes]